MTVRISGVLIKSIRAKLLQCVLVREITAYSERSLNKDDINKLFPYHSRPQLVMLSTNGVIRIELHDNCLVVGYPTKAIAKNQLIDRLFRRYFRKIK